MANRCADPFNLYNAPAGNKTAYRFPWWQSGAFIRETGVKLISAGERFRFRPIGPKTAYLSGGQPLFNNPQSWPVYITEVRFIIVMDLGRPVGWAAGDFEDIGRQIGIRMSTSTQGEILREFVPMSALSTDPIMAQEFGLAKSTITLPGDYFLPADADFGVEAGNTAMVGGRTYTIQLGLRGCDPYNNTPVIRFSESQDITQAINGKPLIDFTLGGAPGGQAVRNMWLRDIVLSAASEAVPVETAGDFWQQASLKFHPPQGPRWTTDHVTCAALLTDQVSTHLATDLGALDPWGGLRHTVVSHKPVTPYLLMPQDKFDIEATAYTQLTQDGTEVPLRILAITRGYQEVPSDAI